MYSTRMDDKRKKEFKQIASELKKAYRFICTEDGMLFVMKVQYAAIR